MAYAEGSATTRRDMCYECMALLREIGLEILDGIELLEWIVETDPLLVVTIMQGFGWENCYFVNPIDQAMNLLINGEYHNAEEYETINDDGWWDASGGDR